MITAVTEATVPKICVIVRKAYGAGLYAMCGPAFDPIATLALPTAKIAVMGPEAGGERGVRQQDRRHRRPRRAGRVRGRAPAPSTRRTSTCCAWPSELVIDAVVPFEALRDELIGRFAAADPVDRDGVAKRHGVPPV